MINQVETLLFDKLETAFELAKMRSCSKCAGVRTHAYEIFKQLGFPTVKHEEWKNTSVQPFLKVPYELETSNHQISPEELDKTSNLIAAHSNEIQAALKGAQKGVYRLILVDGVIDYKHSYLPKIDGLKIKPLTEAESDPIFDKYFATIATVEGNSFVALNTATFIDGLFIEVSKDFVLDKPLHIVHSFVTTTPMWVQPRTLIVVKAGASLELIETMVTDCNDHPVVVNAVTEVALERNAHFDHYEIQTGEPNLKIIKRTEASQETNSNYSNYTFTFPGADFVRNDLHLHLEDKDLESHLYGLYLTKDKQLVDNHTAVHHKFPNGESNQLYKGILLDESRAVFNGKIFVYEDAQKTNAFQQSSNLLFSDKATVNAKPQLEIFADDVKCSHGTTIGQMNKDALFYLKSRGIGEEAAKGMMMTAFAFDVIDKVKNESLKAYLSSKVMSIIH